LVNVIRSRLMHHIFMQSSPTGNFFAVGANYKALIMRHTKSNSFLVYPSNQRYGRLRE
jgi:hypothetical protein